jgi:preprotein translocase subunit SecE
MTPVREWWPRTKIFTREVIAEGKKVTWPDRKTVINTTIVVIVATFIIGFFLWGCDLVLTPLINKLYKLLGA